MLYMLYMLHMLNVNSNIWNRAMKLSRYKYGYDLKMTDREKRHLCHVLVEYQKYVYMDKWCKALNEGILSSFRPLKHYEDKRRIGRPPRKVAKLRVVK